MKIYAYELVEDIEDDEIPENFPDLEKLLLNGAKDWQEYSSGGCAFCYDCDIAKRLCTPSELRRTDGGREDPNKRETWIDVQGRALFQANILIKIAHASAKSSH